MTTHVFSDAALGYYAGSNQYFYYDSRVYQEKFCLLVNWLASLTAIGVTQIASYYGAAVSDSYMTLTGTGFNTWDLANSAGTNAWALFEFSSAATPFYVLVQWTGSGVALGATGDPASSGSNASGASGGGIFVSFAYKTNGASPWNGTTNNNGADTKGSLVWNSGSYIFPRSNSIHGADAVTASRMFCFGVYGYQYNAQTPHMRMYAVADASNFTIVIDYLTPNQGTSSTSREQYPEILHFGPFTPTNDLAYTSAAQYFCLNDGSSLSNANFAANNTVSAQTFGNTTFSGDNTGNREGGIALPTPGVVTGLSWDVPGNSQFNNIFANPGQEYVQSSGNSIIGRFVEPPLLLTSTEPSSTNNSLGLVGFSTSWLRVMYGVMPYTTTNTKTRIAIGIPPLTNPKYTIPWNVTAYTPGTNISRVGSST